MGERTLDNLVEAIQTFDFEKISAATMGAVNAGIDPARIIEDGLAKGLRIVGKRFEEGELFLMHLVAAAEASKRAISEILEPMLAESKTERKSLGKVVIGTVAGDIHDIGKNIVAAMLFAAGFEVHDLGKDTPASLFVDKAREADASIVASSALLTTTMPVQREIIEGLVSTGLRGKVRVLVGGAPVTQEWVKEIGADAYGENAVEAVSLTKKLLNLA